MLLADVLDHSPSDPAVLEDGQWDRTALPKKLDPRIHQKYVKTVVRERAVPTPEDGEEPGVLAFTECPLKCCNNFPESRASRRSPPTQ